MSSARASGLLIDIVTRIAQDANINRHRWERFAVVIQVWPQPEGQPELTTFGFVWDAGDRHYEAAPYLDGVLTTRLLDLRKALHEMGEGAFAAMLIQVVRATEEYKAAFSYEDPTLWGQRGDDPDDLAASIRPPRP